MTQLRQRKTTMKTQTAASYNGRALVIELHPGRPGELFIREARRRAGYWVPFLAIYQTGAKILANERRRAEGRPQR